VVLADDGWFAEANVPALSLLGITDGLAEPRHFSDFIAPGALDDAQALLSIIATGRELTATLLFRPIGGEVLAADVRAARERDVLVVLFSARRRYRVGRPAPPAADRDLDPPVR